MDSSESGTTSSFGDSTPSPSAPARKNGEEYSDMEDEFGDEQMTLPPEESPEVLLMREFNNEDVLELMSVLTKREMKPIMLFFALHADEPSLGWLSLCKHYLKLKIAEHGGGRKSMHDMYKGHLSPTGSHHDTMDGGMPSQYRPSSGKGDGRY